MSSTVAIPPDLLQWQKMMQEFLKGQEELAENHRAKRCLGTQCERAKRTLSAILVDGTVVSLFEELNTDYSRNSKGPFERCDSGTDKLNVTDVVHVHGSTQRPIAQKTIPELHNGKDLNR